MRTFRHKLTDRKGETLVESLTAILLMALSSCMFFHFLAVSGRLMSKGQAFEDKFYRTLSLLEAMEEDESQEELVKSGLGKVTVSIKSESGVIAGEQVSVRVYYGGTLAAYRIEDGEKVEGP